MNILNSIDTLQKTIIKYKDKTIGFVPTMGALHQGHISLIQQAKEENDIVVVSIFVNPTQFLAGEDLDKYPSKLEADIKILQMCDVDILFTPTKETIYGKDEVLIKAPILKSYILEGERRAGHFDGVLQIVLKLFNLVKPTNAYFGKKDAQQLILIEQMVKNLFLDINIVRCDIVREADGLAMSSRNVYLTTSQRKLSLQISAALRTASNLISQNCIDSKSIKKAMEDTLHGIDIEYIAIVNHTFEVLETVEFDNTIILIAVKIGTTRLIDNLWV